MLKKCKIWCMLMVLLLMIAGCSDTAIHRPGNAGEVAGEICNPVDNDVGQDVHKPNADEIIRLTNEYRVSHGLPPLEKDPVLCEVAEIRAKEIVTTWSHTRPDGTKFYNILFDMNYQADAAGENLGRYQTSVEEVMQMWKDSESHNKNMLSEYSKIGTAVYELDGEFYFVQIFAR